MKPIFPQHFLLVFFLFFSSHIFAEANEQKKAQLDSAIKLQPNNIEYRMQRAQLLFDNNQHQAAVDDYNHIIKTNKEYYQAYFGRGMALGRLGEIQAGIDDISVFIQHNPMSSLAYTKRGVRYLWLGEMDNAQNDFLKAIAINPKNAEAHDDIGVIYAQKNQPDKAISHFQSTIKYDPSYQKAYHNLALTYFIYDNSQAALSIVNKAIALSPNSKDTLLLKSEILSSLGQNDLAEKLKEDALFLPEGNWSESMPIQQ